MLMTRSWKDFFMEEVWRDWPYIIKIKIKSNNKGSPASPLSIKVVVSFHMKVGRICRLSLWLFRSKVEIRMQCGNSSRSKLPLPAVVLMWPLICLKSPKQQREKATFYYASMRKGDRANLAWRMGSNWMSKAGIKELSPTIKLCSSQRSHIYTDTHTQRGSVMAAIQKDWKVMTNR